MLPGVDGGDGLRNVSCSNVEGRVLGWVIVTRRGCDETWFQAGVGVQPTSNLLHSTVISSQTGTTRISEYPGVCDRATR